MTAYYLDSSALVKRYVAEVGTIWVRGITSASSSSILFVSLVSGAEVVSAISRRSRQGSLSAADASQSITDFQNHFQNQYRILALTREIVDRSMDLGAGRYLRGYDAVQLATALILNEEAASSGGAPIVLISADSDLNDAAALEGLSVEDPNAHADPFDLVP